MTDSSRPDDQDAVRPLPDISLDPVSLPGGDALLASPPATRRRGAAPESMSVPTRVEAASGDVVVPGEEAGVPGVHRGGFTRPPTAPLDVLELHPVELEPGEWEPESSDPVSVRVPGSIGVGGNALVLACFGLAASLVVGWVFPLGVIALVLGLVAVRRGVQRGMAVWAIVLAVTSLVYSAGWLLFAARQAGWIG